MYLYFYLYLNHILLDHNTFHILDLVLECKSMESKEILFAQYPDIICRYHGPSCILNFYVHSSKDYYLF